MARDTLTQHGFNAGELSPFLNARSDIDRYAYGARNMVNFIPMLQGPARKRPGTKYVHDLKERSWLMPVTFSPTDSWILAFGDSKLRFFTDRGPVLETAKTITAATQASPGVITSASHGFANGDEVYISSVGGMTQLNGRIFVVRNQTTNTFTLEDMWGVAVNTSAYGAYTSGGSAQRLYKIVSPFPISALTDSNGCCLMSWAQSEDVIYICVPGYQPRKLTRASSTSWAFTTFEPRGGPFIGVDPDETITVYSGAATGTSQTLTASSAIFTASHVGSLFLLEKKLTEVTSSWEAGKSISSGDDRRSQGHYYNALNSATTGAIVPSHTIGSRYDGDAGVNWDYLDSGYGWAEITAIGGGGTTATVDILSRFNAGSVGSGNASTQWSHGAWSTSEGWPTHVCFFRERLCFARGTKIWMSVPSDFENFAERDAGVVADDSAISIDIRQGYNDQIQWMLPSADLLIGAEGNEFSVGEISTADPLGPGNVASLRGPGYGARRVQPALVNDGVMYALPGGRVVRELRFAFETDGYTALNRTAFAEHITRGLINQMAFAKEPESIVWNSCADGAWVGMSFEREHQLMAWHRQQLGGSGLVESHAVIPSPDGDRDEWYACVKRTINSQTKYYLEYLTDHWDENTQDLEDMYYVDCGLSASSSSAATLSGLEHLEGASVAVLRGGRSIGAFTVSAGAITLAASAFSSAAAVHAGLSYSARLESLNLHRPNFMAAIINVFVHFVSTVFAKAGGASTTDRSTRKTWGPRAIGWTFSGYDVTAPIPAQTRVVRVRNEGDHAREAYFEITHDEPTACTIAGWMLETEKG
ncbi:MAG: ubiquitin-activating E1 FCCH domain-containing protein [Hyphomonadaceae bacterium]